MTKNRFHLRNIKITSRLFIAFCSLVLLVIGIISMAQFYWYTNDTKTKIGDYAIDNLKQITIALDSSLNRMDDYYLEIASGNIVQNALVENPQPGTIDYINYQYRFQQMVAQKYSFFKYIRNIFVLSEDFTPVLAYTNIYQDSSLKEETIRSIAESDKDTFGERKWNAVSNDDGGIKDVKNKRDSLVFHSLIDPMWGKSPKGYMIAEIRPAFFLDVFSQPQSVNGIETFILDSEGVVMASFDNGKLPIGKTHFDPEIMGKMKENPEFFHYENQSELGMLAWVPVKNTNLYAVSFIPDEYFKSANQGMKSFLAVSSFLFLLLSGIIAIVITKSIHVPLKQLSLEMDKVKQGNFKLCMNDPYHDEISDIKLNFSYMIREVERLTKDIRIQERQKKKAEISALQAQINPHFLSNTLGSIQWMAQLQGVKNIEDITGNLIHLLHMCAQKGNSRITMEEELTYLKCYINVQKYRYLDKVLVEFLVEPEVLPIEVPQFILQPVIENAIIHGIEPKSGQGTILIVCKKGERLRIEIQDDGVGIPMDRLGSIFDGGRKGKANLNHIGLNNVKERLDLYYGKDYLIDIVSREGEYTSVKLELPCQMKEEDEGES